MLIAKRKSSGASQLGIFPGQALYPTSFIGFILLSQLSKPQF
jgi:hypothetical protein